MATTTPENPTPESATPEEPAAGTKISVLQATSIGVGSMVGAGIFALLGAAGEVAGAAVWLSFLLAGGIAFLQGYSFARFGARYPSGGGLLTYLSRGLGEGHVTGVTSWLLYIVNAVIGAMVALSFGSYASAVVAHGSAAWAKVFAVLIVLAMTALNVAGPTAVARVQAVIVNIVITILVVFAVVTIVNLHPSLLAPSGYPGVREIVSSVALTFFAFLGFGVITFTAKDLADPARQLPRAMFLALGIATTIYVGVSLGVFGTLPVDEVISSGGTALAEAAKPTLGQFGYVLMVITALFSTAGATNSTLYPAVGVSRYLASVGQFPPVLGRSLGRRKVSVGLLGQAAVTVGLCVGFDLGAVASIGSAVALLVFTTVTAAHLRVRRDTGARLGILLLALATTLGTLVVFCVTTLVDEPATIVALGTILVLSIGVDLVWKWRRDLPGRTPAAATPLPPG